MAQPVDVSNGPTLIPDSESSTGTPISYKVLKRVKIYFINHVEFHSPQSGYASLISFKSTSVPPSEFWISKTFLLSSETSTDAFYELLGSEFNIPSYYPLSLVQILQKRTRESTPFTDFHQVIRFSFSFPVPHPDANLFQDEFPDYGAPDKPGDWTLFELPPEDEETIQARLKLDNSVQDFGSGIPHNMYFTEMVISPAETQYLFHDTCYLVRLGKPQIHDDEVEEDFHQNGKDNYQIYPATHSNSIQNHDTVAQNDRPVSFVQNGGDSDMYLPIGDNWDGSHNVPYNPSDWGEDEFETFESNASTSMSVQRHAIVDPLEKDPFMSQLSTSNQNDIHTSDPFAQFAESNVLTEGGTETETNINTNTDTVLGNGNGSVSKIQISSTFSMEDNLAYFYAYTSPKIHQEMLDDVPRVKYYSKALRKLVEGKIVLDVGAGTGILSMLSARFGAKHVYCVEGSAGLAYYTQKIIEANELQDKITLITGDITDLGPQSIPKADIIVSEWMGSGLFYEGMLLSFLHARNMFSKSKTLTTLVPSGGSIFIVPVSIPKLVEERISWWKQPFTVPNDDTPGTGNGNGVDNSQKGGGEVFSFAPMESFAMLQHSCRPLLLDVNSYNPVYLAEPVSIDQTYSDLNLKMNERWQIEYLQSDFVFDINTGGNVDGFAIWFSVELAPDVSLSTSPDNPLTHWKQMVCLLNKDLFVNPNTKLSGSISMSAPQEGKTTLIDDKDDNLESSHLENISSDTIENSEIEPGNYSSRNLVIELQIHVDPGKRVQEFFL